MNKARCPVLCMATVCFIVGIVCLQVMSMPLAFLWALVGVAVVIVMSRRSVNMWMFILLFILLGFLYSHSMRMLHQHHIVYIAKYIRYKPISVQGVIVSEIKKKKLKNTTKVSFTLNIHSVISQGVTRKAKGKVLVNLFEEHFLKYGDTIEVSGRLHKPFEFSDNSQFSYRDYLKNKHVYYVISVKKGNTVRLIGPDSRYTVRAILYQLRMMIIRQMSAYLTWQEQGILNAILLGERSSIPHNIRELFIKTGTAHILSISGLHVGIVGLLIMSLLQVLRFPRLGQLIFSAVILLLYILLAGARPSIVRAAIMAVIFIGGLVMDRESHPLTMLSFASLFILMINPFNVYDIGFQLSFICVWSIIVIRPKLQALFNGVIKSNQWPRWAKGINQSVLVSLSVCIGIEPLIAYYFEIITPVTILANIFIIPLMGLVVCVGFGFMIAMICCAPLAVLFSMCLKVLLNVMVAMSFLLAQIPYAYIFIKDITCWHLITYYSIILVIFLLPWGIISDKINSKPLRHNN